MSFIGRTTSGTGRTHQALEKFLPGAKRSNRRNAEFAEADIFAQRIAGAQELNETARQFDNRRNLEREAAVLDLARQVAAGFEHFAGAIGQSMQASQKLRRRSRSAQLFDT
jgi:hypothetical protein